MRLILFALSLTQAFLSASCLGDELPPESLRALRSLQSSQHLFSPRIIGGEEAEVGRYPYAVFLAGFEGDTASICGGTLLTPDTVLSAAHCFNSTLGAESYIALAGGHDLADLESFQFSDIRDVIAHPAYDSVSNDNDFALFLLSTSMSVETLVQINSSPDVPSPRESLVVMGWGTSNLDLNATSDVLKEAEIFAIDNEECSLFWGITDNMLCALGAIQGSCLGDSGGPIIIKGDDASQDIQVGLVSFGIDNCSPTFPEVEARISSQHDWIITTACDNSDFIPDGFGCDDAPTEGPPAEPAPPETPTTPAVPADSTTPTPPADAEAPTIPTTPAAPAAPADSGNSTTPAASGVSSSNAASKSNKTSKSGKKKLRA